MVSAVGTPTQFECSAQVNFGLNNYGNTAIFSYNEPNTNTVAFQQIQQEFVAANTTNNSYNLATIFSQINTGAVVGWYDATPSPGQQLNWGMASSGSRFNMLPQGFSLLRINNTAATLPTIFVDNPSSSVVAILVFFILAN